MLKNFDYKKKTFTVSIFAIVFSIMAYNLAFKKTLTLIQSCKAIEHRVQKIKRAPKQIADLQSQLDIVEHKIGTYDNNSINFRQSLLEYTGKFCDKNNIIIKELPEPNITEEQNYIIETNNLVLEGKYINLVQFVYYLEQQIKLGKVISTKYYSIENKRTKKLSLTANIYIQNIIRNE